jgi:hypothetical protein
MGHHEADRRLTELTEQPGQKTIGPGVPGAPQHERSPRNDDEDFEPNIIRGLD